MAEVIKPPENETPLPGVGAPEEGHTHKLDSSEDSAIDANAQATSPINTGQLVVTPFHKVSPRISGAYLVKGIVPRASFGALYGHPGSGKSFLALDMGLHIAAGLPWFGRRTRKGAVLYVALEGEAGIMNRVVAAREALGLPDDLPFHLAHGSADLLHNKASAREIIAHARALEAKTGLPCELVVIDTLSRALCGGEENMSTDMGALVANLGLIHCELGSTVLAVHHPAKEGDEPRGHGSLNAALDFKILVDRGGLSTDTRSFCIKKQKDGEDGKRYGFDLEQVDLGTDEDGDPVTSCVVRQTDTPPPGRQPRSLPASAKNALKALEMAIAKGGEEPPGDCQAPAGKKVVPEELWRRYCDTMGVADSDNPDSRRRAFKRAADALLARDAIKKWNKHVWIV